MRSPARPLRRSSPAASFRAQIEKAEAEGCSRADMTLRVTLSDASLLKRDPDLALSDIGFVDQTMRFLGVVIEEGGVAQSELVRARPAQAD